VESRSEGSALAMLMIKLITGIGHDRSDHRRMRLVGLIVNVDDQADRVNVSDCADRAIPMINPIMQSR